MVSPWSSLHRVRGNLMLLHSCETGSSGTSSNMSLGSSKYFSFIQSPEGYICYFQAQVLPRSRFPACVLHRSQIPNPNPKSQMQQQNNDKTLFLSKIIYRNFKLMNPKSKSQSQSQSQLHFLFCGP